MQLYQAPRIKNWWKVERITLIGQLKAQTTKCLLYNESPIFHVASWIFNCILTDSPQCITGIGTERVSTVPIRLTDWVIHGEGGGVRGDLIEKDKKMTVLSYRLLTVRKQIRSVTIKLHYHGLKLSLFSVTDTQAWE